MYIRSIKRKCQLCAPDGPITGPANPTPVAVETTGMASKMERLEQKTHSASNDFLDQPKVQLTPRGVSFEPDQVEYLLMHYRNPPVRDGLLTVNQIFHMLEDKAISYQLEHNDAFYSQNQRVLRLVLKDTEDINSWSDEYIRLNHREFSRRLAHWYYHFINYSTMWLCSAANLCILGHVKGKGKYHDTGEAFKLGRINNALTRLGAYFLPKNLAEYITGPNSAFGVGQVNAGAYAFSIPYFNTALYSSPSRCTVKISDAIGGVAPDGITIKALKPSAQDWAGLTELQRNMDRVRREFIRNDVVAVTEGGNTVLHCANRIADILNDGDQKMNCNVVPSTPYIENGDVVSIDSGLGVSFNCGCNGDMLYQSKTRQKVGDSTYVDKDNLINRTWDTFDYWMEAMEQYFTEMSNQTSPVVKFWSDFGLLDQPVTAQKFWNSFDTSKTVTLDSLREQMVYKKDNRPAAAGQIKFAPIFDTFENSWKGDDFDINFNRYPVDGSDDVATARSSDKFPSCTPVIFHDVTGDASGEMEPFVANIGPCGSIQADLTPIDGDSALTVHGIQGKYAAMLDYLSSSVFDYLRTDVSFIGADGPAVKEFLDNGNGFAYRETLTEVHTPFYPIVDNSDPYQCGFYLLVFSDSSDRCEHEDFFMNADSIPSFDSAAGGNGSPLTFKAYSSAPDIPLATAVDFLSDSSDYVLPKVANKDYLKRQRYCFIFLGDTLWFHPEMTQFLKAVGNPTEYYGESALDGELHDLLGDVETAITGITSNSNGTIDFDASSAVSEEIVGAAFLGESMVQRSAMIQKEVEGESVDVNPVSQVQGAIQAAYLSENTIELMHTNFNPTYGPMVPILYAEPDVGQSDGYWSLMFPNTGDQQKTLTSTVDIMSGIKMLGTEFNSDSSKDRDWQVIPAMRGDLSHHRALSVNQFYLWFIDNMHLTKVYRKGSRLFAPDKLVSSSGASGLSKIALALLARGRIEHLGSEDSQYFNNIKFDVSRYESYSYDKANPVNFGSILMDAKVTARAFKSRVAFRPSTGPSITITTQSASSDSSEMGESGNDNRKGGHNNGKSNKGKDGSKRQGSKNFSEAGSRREAGKAGKSFTGSEREGKSERNSVKGFSSKEPSTDDRDAVPVGGVFQPTAAKPQRGDVSQTSQSAAN